MGITTLRKSLGVSYKTKQTPTLWDISPDIYPREIKTVVYKKKNTDIRIFQAALFLTAKAGNFPGNHLLEK